MAQASMRTALPFPPCSSALLILAPDTADSAAMDPREKSNLPLFRLMERAMVVIITMAAYSVK